MQIPAHLAAQSGSHLVCTEIQFIQAFLSLFPLSPTTTNAGFRAALTAELLCAGAGSWDSPKAKRALGGRLEPPPGVQGQGWGGEGGAETWGAAALTAAQPRLPAGRQGQPGCANLQRGDRDLPVGRGKGEIGG